MLRLLLFLVLSPLSAAAAGLDISADELTQNSDGTVVASGNVVIQQHPARIVRNIRAIPTDVNTVRVEFDMNTEPSASGKPEHRILNMVNTSAGWKITDDQISDSPITSDEPVAVPLPSLKDAIESWRDAWSSKDSKRYFSAYSETFRPEPRFASSAIWRTKKMRAITNKKFIDVSLQDIRIQPLGSTAAMAEFMQYYASDLLNSRDIKQLKFELTEHGWKITSEAVIPAFTITSRAASRESPEQAVTGWKNAWNRRDLDAYLSHYMPEAYPAGLFATRLSWIASLQTTFALKPTLTMRADKVQFDRANHTIRADGHVHIQSADGRIEAASAEINSETRAGSIEQATLYLPGGERLQARYLTRINDTTFEAEDARFTACPEDAESWVVKTKKAHLDQQEGELTAQGTSFQLAGIPVLYTPWWSQQLKRKSGLLTPRVASGKRRGTELGIPIYLAPAANWDATLTPTSMTARGVMGETELRHVSGLGSERIDVAGIHDKVTGTTRSRLQSDIKWRLPSDISLSIQADHVSDHNYMADYATGSDASQRYLQSTATLAQSYLSDSFSMNWMLMGQHHQDLTQASNAATLQIQPRLQSNLQWQALDNAYFHFDQQTTRFARRTGIDGWRMALHPYVEFPWQLAGGGLSATLQAGSHYTRYWLQNGVNKVLQQRTTGEASLEIRSDFERLSSNNVWRHQISPIIRYDYIQAPDQTGMVNLDSTFGGLTWSNLLSGNRYSGQD
ncbi:MAG TPA: LPS assembly protein LptD, partial [Mariprofundaceae bacterium]|nr:LPS assembly protein LptD [Mariprofundaceae bacterium]